MHRCSGTAYKMAHCRFRTVRSSELTSERLFRDLGQIAEAILTRLLSVEIKVGSLSNEWSIW